MKEIILYGGGDSRKECPFDAETWAVASVLSFKDVDPTKINRVFAFDAYHEVKRDLDIADKNKIPIISTLWYGQKYPLDKIHQTFEHCYLRPSISYMMALAIYEGYDFLRLYGIDQGPQWKYLLHKQYIFFWLGVAEGKGVKYTLPKSSTLELPMEEEFEKNVNGIRKKIGQYKEIVEDMTWQHSCPISH